MLITPLTSMQIPRHISRTIKALTNPVIIWLESIGEYIRIWDQVYNQ